MKNLIKTTTLAFGSIMIFFALFGFWAGLGFIIAFLPRYSPFIYESFIEAMKEETDVLEN